MYVTHDLQGIAYAAAVLQAPVECLEETLVHVVVGRVSLHFHVYYIAVGVQDWLQRLIPFYDLQFREILERNA